MKHKVKARRRQNQVMHSPPLVGRPTPSKLSNSQNPLSPPLLQSMVWAAHLCPLPIHCRDRVRSREGPDALHTLLSSISVLSALFWAKPKPWHSRSCYGEMNSVPARPIHEWWLQCGTGSVRSEKSLSQTCCSRYSWRGLVLPAADWSDCPLVSPCCSYCSPPQIW